MSSRRAAAAAAAAADQDDDDEAMKNNNRSSGNIKMSPTPFRGVLMLEEETTKNNHTSTAPYSGLPAIPGIQESPGNNNGGGGSSSRKSHHQSHHHHHHHHYQVEQDSSAAAAASASATAITLANPLAPSTSTSTSTTADIVQVPPATPLSPQPQIVRSRKASSKKKDHHHQQHQHRHQHHHHHISSSSHSKTSDGSNERKRHRRKRHHSSNDPSHHQDHPSDLSQTAAVGTAAASSSSGSPSKRSCSSFWLAATTTGSKCCDRTLVRSTLSFMNILARILFWCSAGASVAAVLWYSYELKKHGTDPHLIAWFSAGAFVLLGFPISMYGIVMHLANYNQPNVQNYVVRILWMVPIYSIESWLCLRYKDYAIYIETLRDCYESYVLYSFLQFLIQVLGGEEALILMLKDKSPTRGVHMWGLQWCVKPWLMGQPLRKTFESAPPPMMMTTTTTTTTTTKDTEMTTTSPTMAPPPPPPRTLKRVHWTSPFFVQCKFGVLQYVLLKIILSVMVMVLEKYGVYKEGDFTPKGGYLYICILTNLSQCWALYCLIFFYYATKNELSNIRPVGKFLSVKALVFFTWWQSLAISIVYQMDLIPHYHGGSGMGLGGIIISGGGAGASGAAGFGGGFGTTTANANTDDSIMMMDHHASGDGAGVFMPLTAEEALRLDEFGGSVLSSDSSSSFFSSTGGASQAAQAVVQQQQQQQQQQEWSPEDVAKGLQDYLICIEMFVAAIVHIFVFSHTEYDPQAVEARTRALNQTPHKDWNKRLGRKGKQQQQQQFHDNNTWDSKSAWSGTTNTSRDADSQYNTNFELASLSNNHQHPNYHHQSMTASAVTVANGSFDDEDDLRIHPLDRLDERSRDKGEEEEEEDDGDDEENRERKPLLALDPIEDDEDGGASSLQSLQSSILHGSSSYLDGGGDGSSSSSSSSYSSGDDEDEADVENPRMTSASASVPSMGRGSPSRGTGGGGGTTPTPSRTRNPGFVRALLDSAIPQDLRDNTVGIIKGDYVVEKKTLLHHAATSDSYDLFSRVGLRRPKKPSSIYTNKSSSQSVD